MLLTAGSKQQQNIGLNNGRDNKPRPCAVNWVASTMAL